VSDERSNGSFQEKAIAHPTDARLTHRAIEKLVELAKRALGVPDLTRRTCSRPAASRGRHETQRQGAIAFSYRHRL